MSSLEFEVRTLKNLLSLSGKVHANVSPSPPPANGLTLTKTSTKDLSAPLRRDGRLQIALYFPRGAHRIKNIVVKNAASAFVTIHGGTAQDLEVMASKPTGIVEYARNLPVLVPETQLMAPSQFMYQPNHAPPATQPLPNTPLYKVKAFPASKLNPYAIEHPYSFLVLEFKPFRDIDRNSSSFATSPDIPESPSTVAGVAWVEVFGTLDTVTPSPVSSPSPIFDVLGTLASNPAPASDVKIEHNSSIKSEPISSIPSPSPMFSSPPPSSSPSSRPPMVCPTHGPKSMARRIDRRFTPPKEYYICLENNAQCGHRIDV